MAKLPGKVAGVEPVLIVGHRRSSPHDPDLCSCGGRVDRGSRRGRDDDPADFGFDDTETAFAYGGTRGVALDTRFRKSSR